MLTIFFYKCFSTKVTEQIVNQIILFSANFKDWKDESK